MPESKAVHIRYAAGSLNLTNFLIDLGYELCESEGHGLSLVKTYKLGKTKKRVRTSFQEITLFELLNGNEVVSFRGYTIHNEILIFFSKRELFNVKTQEDGTNL